jgi:hypothetical protein
MKNLGYLFALLIAAAFTFQSCQKDANDPYAGKEAPQLPAPATFVMPMDDNFDEFTEDQIHDRGAGNWVHAAANVLVWNTILTANLIVPVAAFHESFNHPAVYQGYGVWLWEYNVTDGNGVTYHAKLYGELLATEEVKWDMYISQVGGFTNVHWYTGITAWDQSYASWTLNFNPNNPQPFIGIQYQRDNGAGVASIRYTNIIPGNVGNGGYIEYREGAYNGGLYDRAYDVYKIEIDNLMEINWNDAARYGRVKDFEKFGNTDWHCWDGLLQDTQC